MAIRRLRAAGLAAAIVAGLSTWSPLRAAESPLCIREQHYRADLLERYVSPEGVVLYRIDPTTFVRDLREGRYPLLADSPSFTGQWAAGACLRAGYARGRALREAVSNVDLALGGLEALSEVTGAPGLYARTLRRAPPPAGAAGRWFRGAGRFEAYFWRGNVSMDQYANGVLPALWACRKLCPARARGAASALADLLLETGLQLVDPDGRPRRLGDLSPSAGMGLNSIAMLTGYAAFSLAARLDPEPAYREERDRLRDRMRVPARARVTNLRVLGRAKRSNDLMAWNLLRVPVPLALRAPSSFEWKADPYRLVQGVAPHTEYSGLDFLVAYRAYRSLPQGRSEPVRL